MKDDITLTEPAPGHFVISGHRPPSIFVPDVGHIVPAEECHIPASVPTDLLKRIIDAREPAPDAPAPRRATGGRSTKAKPVEGEPAPVEPVEVEPVEDAPAPESSPSPTE